MRVAFPFNPLVEDPYKNLSREECLKDVSVAARDKTSVFWRGVRNGVAG